MKTKLVYQSPPVIEALCEIFFEDSEWDNTFWGEMYETLKKSFPIKRSQHVRKDPISLDSSGKTTIPPPKVYPRMRFLSEDQKSILQIGENFIVLNRLQPYPHFDTWIPVLYTAVNKYRELAKPKKIVRLGLRYINHVRIPLPSPKISIKDYFNIYPKFPDPFEWDNDPFLLQTEIRVKGSEHTTLISFSNSSPDPNQSTFILDLYDKITGLPNDLSTEKSLKKEVDRAHSNISNAFEGSTTDKLRQVFEQVK